MKNLKNILNRLTLLYFLIFTLSLIISNILMSIENCLDLLYLGKKKLLKKEIFKFIKLENILNNIYIFNSQFIDEIKDAGTNKVFKKFY